MNVKRTTMPQANMMMGSQMDGLNFFNMILLGTSNAA
jgi:hypothetical protein